MTRDYAGDVSPDEAMALLKSNKDAVLVDVRTQAEWTFVGVPDLSGLDKAPILVEWQSYPTMAPNPNFLPTLSAELYSRNVPVDAPVLFLCRSGARSRAAAMALTGEGRTNCLNIAGGFEGGPDMSRHRGSIEGWKARNLPWTQH
jgi:rhodanese-related sulfurtransferase